MTEFKQKLLDFLHDEEGLETVEYAVAGSLIVAGSVAAFTLLGGNVETAINTLAGAIDTTP